MKLILPDNDIDRHRIKKIIEEHHKMHLEEQQRLEIEFRYLTIKEAYESLLQANIDDLQVFDLYDKRQREYFNNYFKK